MSSFVLRAQSNEAIAFLGLKGGH